MFTEGVVLLNSSLFRVVAIGKVLLFFAMLSSLLSHSNTLKKKSNFFFFFFFNFKLQLLQNVFSNPQTAIQNEAKFSGRKAARG